MRISFIIKTFNEEENIGQCIESIIRCTEDMDSEIIVADSLSSDKTVEIADRHSVRIVQLRYGDDRCCGIAAQLGYQFSTGEFIYVVDGDMILEKDFLVHALKLMESDAAIGGIGGYIKEENLSYTYKRYERYKQPSSEARQVGHISGGGLYRRKAIEDVGCLTNLNLHCFEEMELGIRLHQKGWRLLRLPEVSAHHYGHRAGFWRLLRNRWLSRYFDGHGEILRSALGKPYFLRVTKVMKHLLALLILWVVGLALFFFYPSPVTACVLLLIPVSLFVLLALRKGSPGDALYSTVEWHVQLLSLIRGFARRPKNPSGFVEAVIIK